MNAPDIASFKSQFDRDFPYSTTSEGVMDSDITKALTLAGFIVNESLFADETSFQFAYNFLTAHYLVMNLKNSSQGINGAFNWLETSKSVGSVSQGFQVPQDILNHPQLALLSKTGYGVTYLSIVLPLTYGAIGISAGATLA